MKAGSLQAGTSSRSSGVNKFGQEAKAEAASTRLTMARANMASKRKELDHTMSVHLGNKQPEESCGRSKEARSE